MASISVDQVRLVFGETYEQAAGNITDGLARFQERFPGRRPDLAAVAVFALLVAAGRPPIAKVNIESLTPIST
jgi:hypothetical protein